MVREYCKISTWQMFCILMLSRLSGEVVYVRTVSGTALDAILATVISEVLRFLIALPLIIYSFKGNNFHRAAYNKNRFIGWAGAVIAAVLLAGMALRTMVGLSEFAVKNLLPGGVMWLIFALAAGFAVYSAVMGTEALARAGVIFLVAAAVVTVAVMIADIPFIGKQSIESLANRSDRSTLIEDIFQRAARGGDYLIFAALLPYVRRPRKSSLGKTLILFAVFSTLATVLICFMNGLVLREMYGQCEYPFLAAASLSDISLFKRLDGFAAAVWSLGAAFRAGVLLLSAECAIMEVYRAGHPMKKAKGAAK